MIKKITDTVTLEDVRSMTYKQFINYSVLDLSEVENFHVSFAGFICELKRMFNIKIIRPKNKSLDRVIGGLI